MTNRSGGMATIIVVAVLLIVYLATYFVMSRRGYRESSEFGMKGFYFVLPHDERALQLNRVCLFLFYPLVKTEMWLGTGLPPSSEPMQGLE